MGYACTIGYKSYSPRRAYRMGQHISIAKQILKILPEIYIGRADICPKMEKEEG